MRTVFLNGKYLPLEQAKVSVLDRGFLFADGIYEMIPAYQGKLFRLDQHMNRLKQSLEQTYLTAGLSEPEIVDMLNQLVEKNGGGNLSVYLQITRGAYDVRDHAFPETQNKPTVFAFCSRVETPDMEKLNDTQGQKAITAKDIRWEYCHIKSVSLLANILLKQKAVEAGAQEAILIRNDFVTEGAASNVFIVKNGHVMTPPLTQHILGGITRDLVIEIIKQAISTVPEIHTMTEQSISPAQLSHADEVWITSSTKEIIPITTLDGSPVGSGHVGDAWKKIARLYCDYKRNLCGITA